jgi:hypothetical protein
MEAIYSSETSFVFQQTELRYIPEDKPFLTTGVNTSNPTRISKLDSHMDFLYWRVSTNINQDAVKDQSIIFSDQWLFIDS